MTHHATSARPARAALLPMILIALAAAAPCAVAQTDPPARSACDANSRTVQQIARISNTRDRNFQCLGVKVDGDLLKALRIESHRFDADGRAASDQIVVAEYPVAEIESRDGAVLDGAQGRDAVIVKGHAAAANGDVELVASYLYNGLTGEYRSCRVTLDRRGDTAWRLVNQYNETVSRIVVRTRNVPVLGTIGIANLEGACTPT